MSTNDGKSNTDLKPQVAAVKALMKDGASMAEAAATVADTMPGSTPDVKPAPGKGVLAPKPTTQPVAGPAKPVDATPNSALSIAAKIAAMHNSGAAKPGPAGTVAVIVSPDALAKIKASTVPVQPAAKPAAKPAPVPNVKLPAGSRQNVPVSKAPTAPLMNSAANPFADLMSKAAELGTTAGKGRNTQIQFHLAMVDAAYAGTIDLTTNRHGPDRDDALVLSEAYVRAQNTATIFDPKAPNQRKATSLVRTCIKLGHFRATNGGPGEPVRTVNDLMGEWRKIRNGSDAKLAKRLDDATNTLMRYARAQLKDDRLIPSSRFREFMLRKDRELPDAEELVARARDALQALIGGKAADGTAKDDSQEVTNAHQWLTVRLARIAEERGLDDAAQPPTTP